MLGLSARQDERLRRWLAAQRWFGGKGRQIERLSVLDRATLQASTRRLSLLLIDVDYSQESSERYFVPLIEPLTEEPRDALLDAESCRALLAAIRSWQTLGTDEGGLISFSCQQPAEALPGNGPAENVRPLGLEQSNSSIVFDDTLILKCYRRVQDGPNPDLEVLHFLQTQTGFGLVPRLAGFFEYHGPAGDLTLGMLQEYVACAGDGWSYLLNALLSAASASQQSVALDQIACLGELTGQLHLALASRVDVPAFAPESITRDDLANWHAAILGGLAVALETLRRARGALSGREAALAEVVLASRDKLIARVNVLLEAPAGLPLKSRHHGDYHLGQLLRTPAGWLVLDFEGEPLRPIAERRAKHCALRDVAGLLRSISYARHAAARGGAGRDGRLGAWERAARRVFLDTYFRTSGPAAPFLPDDRDRAHALIAAFELEKAAYELRYEQHNRPDWIDIPLSGLAGLVDG